MPKRKKGRQDCFARKNIMTLTCYTLCQSGRCSEEDQRACDEATEQRLREFGFLTARVKPAHS